MMYGMVLPPELVRDTNSSVILLRYGIAVIKFGIYVSP